MTPPKPPQRRSALDQSNLHQTCLDVASSNPFFVIDAGGYSLYPALMLCYPQHHLPLLAGAYLTEAQLDQGYPYLFAQEDEDVGYKDTVYALAQRGVFSAAKGFRKLGYIYRGCNGQLVQKILGWLGDLHVPVVTYDLGCPGVFAAPSALEQAVLKFQRSGVTNVTQSDDDSDMANFTNIAEQQHFRPQYDFGENAIISQTYASNHPNYQNIANSLVIVNDRWGEERTPGVPLAPGTVRCNAIFKAHGQPVVYDQADHLGGAACDELWMFQAAVDHAPTLQRSALAAGLQAAKTVDFGFTFGPADFTKPHTTYANEYWRVAQFFSSCNCWRLIDRTYHPSF